MTIKELNSPFDVGVAKIIKRECLKQVCVAERAGYTAQELSDMINGRRLIKACDIQRLAKALGVTSDDIYKAGLKGE